MSQEIPSSMRAILAEMRRELMRMVGDIDALLEVCQHEKTGPASGVCLDCGSPPRRDDGAEG